MIQICRKCTGSVSDAKTYIRQSPLGIGGIVVAGGLEGNWTEAEFKDKLVILRKAIEAVGAGFDIVVTGDMAKVVGALVSGWENSIFVRDGEGSQKVIGTRDLPAGLSVIAIGRVPR